jgi:hypothetical protein
MALVQSNVIGIGNGFSSIIGYITKYWYVIAVIIAIIIIYFLFIK